VSLNLANPVYRLPVHPITTSSTTVQFYRQTALVHTEAPLSSRGASHLQTTPLPPLSQTITGLPLAVLHPRGKLLQRW